MSLLALSYVLALCLGTGLIVYGIVRPERRRSDDGARLPNARPRRLAGSPVRQRLAS